MAHMRLCESAVIALVGWYLLYPPFNAQKGEVDPEFPLKKWYMVESFGSQADCERRKIQSLNNLDSQTHYADRAKVAEQRRMRQQAQCVSTDDPRLGK